MSRREAIQQAAECADEDRKVRESYDPLPRGIVATFFGDYSAFIRPIVMRPDTSTPMLVRASYPWRT